MTKPTPLADLVPIGLARKRKRGQLPLSDAPSKRLAPEQLSVADLENYLRYMAADMYSLEAARYVWDAIRGWSHRTGTQRTLWPLAARDYARSGWPLRGFQKWLERTGQVQHPITPERIQEILEHQADVLRAR